MTPEEILTVIASELALSPVMANYISYARLVVSQSFFGANYNMAVALQAAHQWAVNTKRPGEAGVRTYQMQGRLMQSNGGVGVIRDGYDLSNYGLQYRDLVRKCGMGIMTSSEYYIQVLNGVTPDV